MSNTPKLRFPEFKGEWKKSELGKFTQEITRVNPNSDAPIMMISAANGFILQSNKYSKEMTGQSLKKYIELHAGEFAYNHGASKLKKYGACFCLDLDKARIPFVYHCFKLTEGNTKFFSYLLNRTQLDSELARYISSSARMDGLLNISYTDYMKINISVPTLAEQKKIADFLSNVDSIITAETKILNTLQKKKKALMQKLFTRQLRFKSDDGTDFPEWEEKKMSDICTVNQGLQIAIENRLLEKKANCYFYITNEFIKTGTKYKYYIENPPKNVLCTKDDILMTRTGNTGIVVTDIDGCFHNNFFKINYSRDLVIKGFLVQFFKLSTTQKRILVLAGSSTIPDLNHKDFYSLTIQLPCKAEQQKIADCLSSMDSLIQTQQKVVTTWQQRKKALLQQMFI